MPDAVMVLAFPAAKPLDAKGYVTRLHASVDAVVALVPEAVVCAAEQTAAEGRGDPAPSTAAGDMGRVDAAAPEPSPVATETASAAVRGV